MSNNDSAEIPYLLFLSSNVSEDNFNSGYWSMRGGEFCSAYDFFVCERDRERGGVCVCERVKVREKEREREKVCVLMECDGMLQTL